MSALALVDSYRDALEIVYNAKVQMVRVDVLWQKLHRVTKYLDTQAATEFAEVLQ